MMDDVCSAEVCGDKNGKRSVIRDQSGERRWESPCNSRRFYARVWKKTLRMVVGNSRSKKAVDRSQVKTAVKTADGQHCHA